MKAYIDQCKHCTVRVDWAKCRQPPCKYSATWRAQEVNSVNKELLNALEGMVVGAYAVAVPHAGERAVLAEAVSVALAVIKKSKGVRP